MSVYLARTLLLSLGIGIFVILVFVSLEKDMKLPQIIRFKKQRDTYSAEFTMNASRYSSSPGQPHTAAQSIKQNIQVTKARLQAAGFNYKLQPNTDSSYSVFISYLVDTASIRDLLVANTRLSFHDVYTLQDLAPQFTELNNKWPSIIKRIFADTVIEVNDPGTPGSLLDIITPAALYGDASGNASYPPYLGIARVSQKSLIQRLFMDKEVLDLFPSDALIIFGDSDGQPERASGLFKVYAVRNKAELTNKYIKKASSEIGMTELPQINFTFDAAGSKRWEQMTARNIGKPIAICLNDKVLMAPVVVQAITGGQSVIAMGSSSVEQCRILSVLLTSEELVSPVQITRTHIVANSNFSKSPLIAYLDYMLIFLLAFALSFSLIWFVFRPGKRSAVES